MENIHRLIEDIRAQILPIEALLIRRIVVGETERIDGPLLVSGGSGDFSSSSRWHLRNLRDDRISR